MTNDEKRGDRDVTPESPRWFSLDGLRPDARRLVVVGLLDLRLRRAVAVVVDGRGLLAVGVAAVVVVIDFRRGFAADDGGGEQAKHDEGEELAHNGPPKACVAMSHAAGRSRT